ncbi:hypothetical protein BGW39_011496, partial [Mortierella sp. 14UC]
MSFSSPQGHPSPDKQQLSNGGKRTLPQEERASKFRKIYDHELSALGDTVRALRMQRMDEYRQAAYIGPWVKPNLQAPDKDLVLLMDKVKEFLAVDGQVRLILGDSGAGKSTFNRYLEYELWQKYQPGNRISLFINLPALDRPDRELMSPEDNSTLLSYRMQTWLA